MANAFLRGFNNAEQLAQQGGMLGMQQLGGILNIQNMLRQRQMEEQQRQAIQGVIPQFTDPAAALLAMTGNIPAAVSRQFPQQQYKAVGDSLVDITPGKAPTAAFTAPPKQQLVDVDVPGQPGVKQKQWMVPGQAQGLPVGGMAMPEILNPEVFRAKAQLAHASRPQVTTNVLPPQKTFENEDKLRADYSNDPYVKSSKELSTAFGMIEAAYQRPSAANDLAMATKYMKILDPTSVVRESEFALAVNATGLMDKVRNYAASVLEGKKLNPAQRQDFYESAKAINDAFQKKREEVDQQYSEMATGYGLNPQNVIPSLRRRRKEDSQPTESPQPSRRSTDKGGFRLVE